MPILVATRQAEYDMLPVKLQLETAVAVSPLDANAVLARLRDAGPPMQTIAAAVQSDAGMLDLLRSPLLLNMLTLTYARLPEARVHALTGDFCERRRQLISNYITRRFELKRQSTGREDVYTPARTLRWLASLAAYLIQSQQTVFLSDRLRSSLVPSPRMRPLITLTTPLVWGLAAGSILTLAAVLADRLKINWSLRPGESFAIMCALGLTVGLIGELRGPYRLAVRILFASTLTLALVASPYETPDSDPYYMQLLEGLISALLFGLVGEVALRMIGGELPLMEHLSWSWEQARPSVIRFVTGGTVFAVALDVPNWLTMGSMLRLSASRR